MIFFVNLPVAAALAIAALKVIPADTEKPRWRGLDLRGAILATTSLAAIVYAITQADECRLDLHPDARLRPRRARRPRRLRRLRAPHRHSRCSSVERLADRAVGGGLFLMLAAAGSIFGLFLLCSLYLQNVLGTGPLQTGLAFIPLALAAGVGAHAAGHSSAATACAARSSRRFAIAAAGMALLAHVGENGSYLRDVLPGMLVAGFGLGIAVVSVSIAILTGAREDESGMISGLNSTGHEIGGTIGIAIFSTIAAGQRRPRRPAGRSRDRPRVRGSRAPR